MSDIQIAYNSAKDECRVVRSFGDDVERRTRAGLRELRRTTTADKLLRAAGGSKWVAWRAIALYNRDLELPGLWDMERFETNDWKHLYAEVTQ